MWYVLWVLVVTSLPFFHEILFCRELYRSVINARVELKYSFPLNIGRIDTNKNVAFSSACNIHICIRVRLVVAVDNVHTTT